MKSNNLELALRRFEISQENDALSYESHYCNDFSGAESDAYSAYLESLYNDYFLSLCTQIDALIIQDKETARQFLQTKIDLFTETQNEFDLKSTLQVWINTERRFNMEMQHTNDPDLWRKIKNQRDTIGFFIEMIGIQNYYIDKATTEIKRIYDTYNSVGKPKITTGTQTPIQDKQHHIDEYFEKHFPDMEITNKEICEMFGITRQTAQAWFEEGKLIRISDEGKRPIKYDRAKLVEYLKDGIIKYKLLKFF